jgi:PPOX class probable F420-dependent enzyme
MPYDKEGTVRMTPMSFDKTVRRILDGKNFATIATVMPDGAPQSSVVWVKRDGDTVLFSTTTGRKKARNLTRDPRISISIFDIENPYDSVEIRGAAELIPDEGKKLPRELSHKYLGEDPPPAEPDEIRLIVRVIPQKVIRFSA